MFEWCKNIGSSFYVVPYKGIKSLGVVACSRLLDRSTFGQNEFFGTGDFQPCFFERIFSSSYSANCMPLLGI